MKIWNSRWRIIIITFLSILFICWWSELDEVRKNCHKTQNRSRIGLSMPKVPCCTLFLPINNALPRFKILYYLVVLIRKPFAGYTLVDKKMHYLRLWVTLNDYIASQTHFKWKDIMGPRIEVVTGHTDLKKVYKAHVEVAYLYLICILIRPIMSMFGITWLKQLSLK